MSLVTVVNDVCAAVGVDQTSSVFSNIVNNRTMQEMLALANEMTQRIAYDTRDWTALVTDIKMDGVSANVDQMFNQSVFNLPPDFKRFKFTSNIWRPTMPQAPLRFIADHDEWVHRRLWGWYDPRGEWNKLGNQILVAPALITPWANSRAYVVGDKAADIGALTTTYWVAAVKHTSASSGTFSAARTADPSLWTTLSGLSGATIVFSYLNKNCISLASSGYGDAFIADGDTFRLDERVLKLGMIWQWKAGKGTPYSEDLNSYNDALDRVAGADKPSPIMIGRRTISAAAGASYPYPIDPNMVPL
jgi:hypothetical protein